MKSAGYLILLAVVALSIFMLVLTTGRAWALRDIQATCESDDQPTVINGTPYVCLSPAQAAKLYRALQQRGA